MREKYVNGGASIVDFQCSVRRIDFGKRFFVAHNLVFTVRFEIISQLSFAQVIIYKYVVGKSERRMISIENRVNDEQSLVTTSPVLRITRSKIKILTSPVCNFLLFLCIKKFRRIFCLRYHHHLMATTKSNSTTTN